MAREIKSEKETELNNPVEKPSTYNERLVKLIPTEIITAYVTITGIVQGFSQDPKDVENVLWIIIGILAVMTPLYLVKVSNVTKIEQLLFSSFGFLIWAFATHPPIQDGHWGKISATSLASIALILYTLCIPMFYKGDSLFGKKSFS